MKVTTRPLPLALVPLALVPLLLLLSAAAATATAAAAATTTSNPRWRPVVLMHGLLASNKSMEDTKQWIEEDFPGIYVRNVEIGGGINDSVFMNIHRQVDALFAAIRSDPLLADGFNLIGHSQGGLLSRAYIQQRSPSRGDPPVFNFLSWAGPNAGQYGMPIVNDLCPESECPWFTDLMNRLLNDNGWANKEVQDHISFATYWKDPMNYDLYLKTNTFLADLNNERAERNATYRDNILSLNRVLLLHSTQDGVLVPQNSPWWEFFALGQNVTTIPFNQSAQYTEDLLGFRTLNETGRLDMVLVPCNHRQIPRTFCRQYYELYSRPLLNNTL